MYENGAPYIFQQLYFSSYFTHILNIHRIFHGKIKWLARISDFKYSRIILFACWWKWQTTTIIYYYCSRSIDRMKFSSSRKILFIVKYIWASVFNVSIGWFSPHSFTQFFATQFRRRWKKTSSDRRCYRFICHRNVCKINIIFIFMIYIIEWIRKYTRLSTTLRWNLASIRHHTFAFLLVFSGSFCTICVQ